MTKRTNKNRSVPHPPRVDPETVSGGGIGISGERSRSDFAGSISRRLARRTRLRGGAETHDPANRLPLDHGGSAPTSGISPKPPPVLVLYDLLGDALDGDEPSAVYGQYPPGLIGKMLPYLRCERHRILHVCSGSLPIGEGIRVDVRKEALPDIHADGRDLRNRFDGGPPVEDGSIDAVMIDPPYTPGYARSLYGVDYPRPSHLLREAARVVKPEGRIAIVHYITPKPVAGTVFVRAWGLGTGFDMPVRAVTVYERSAVPLLDVPELDAPEIDHVASDAGGCVSWCPACREASA